MPFHICLTFALNMHSHNVAQHGFHVAANGTCFFGILSFTRWSDFNRGHNLIQDEFVYFTGSLFFSLRSDFFEKDQLFIILEFEFGGIDLENSNGTVSAPHQVSTSPLCRTVFCSDGERSSTMSLAAQNISLSEKAEAHTWVICPQLQVQFYFIGPEILFQ